ncbi:MAG: PIG-L family deacetylase [Actinobacteria bacterium]|nr:PIG-L family deacetylase [Actinomycetota bacterium]
MRKILNSNIKIKDFGPLNSTDKILILAPHPDDEAISSAGIIQKAISAGAKVRIVYLTNGEYNQESYLIFEKKPLILRDQFINLGKIRMNEAIKAMKSLGLKKEDLIFLGYPDFGTMDILTEFWDKNKPYSNILEKISNVPYSECKSPGAPYIGQSILSDLEDIIKEFKPSKIIVSSPLDLNRDHQALYLFSRVALWDLKKQIDIPEYYTFLVHAKNWPASQGLHTDYEMDIPYSIKGTYEDWINLYLTKKEIENKYKAVSQYVSQIDYKPLFIVSFVRKNELFSIFRDIKLDKNNKITVSQSNAANRNLSKLSYSLDNNFLIIKLGLKMRIDQLFGISIYLLGYSNSKNFSEMPKIHIDVTLNGISIKDRFNQIDKNKVSYFYEGNDIILKIPLEMLGKPDYVLSHVKTHSGDITLDDSAWHILEINY